MEYGDPPKGHDDLIELVACPESGLLHLFSQRQLQVRMIYGTNFGVFHSKQVVKLLQRVYVDTRFLGIPSDPLTRSN